MQLCRDMGLPLSATYDGVSQELRYVGPPTFDHHQCINGGFIADNV
jgi:hypothetical protein